MDQVEVDNPVRKDYWKKMKTELEISSYPTEQIGRTIRDSIEEEIYQTKFKSLGVPREEYKWHSGYFYRWCRTENISQNYVTSRTPLGESKNSSINTPIPDHIKNLINIYHNIADEIDEFTTKLHKEHEILKLDLNEMKQLELSIHSLQSFCMILKGIRDEKTKIPLNTIHALLYSLATEASVSYGAEMFFKTRLDYIAQTRKQLLTPKQAIKFQKGETNIELDIFRPHTRDLAIFHSYYGLQCPKCESWRVKERTDGGHQNNLKCFDCDCVFPGKTVSKCRYCQIPLFKDELLHIIKTNHCENCNTEINLPAEVRAFAEA